MKKAKYLVGVLAVSTMLMGAGYAYWTDSLTINNTVSTGEFKVDFIDDEFYPKIFGRTNEAYLSKSIVQNNAKSTTVTVGNMYPDSYVRYEIKAKNTGTIPAVFDNAVVTFGASNTPGFANVLKTQVFVTKWHADGTQYRVGEPGYWAGRSLGYQPAANLQANLNTILAGLRLEPNEFITFDVPDEYLQEYLQQNPDSNGECVEILLPSTVGSAQNPNEFENATAQFTMQLNWKQHNAQ